MTKLILTIVSLVFLCLPAAAQQPGSTSKVPAPKVDHHQHLFSPAMAEFQKIQPIFAKDVIALLDAAGIERAVLLSTAYSYGRPGREPKNEYEMVKEENDWNALQSAQYPERLTAFCSFNPLKDYALTELERCSTDPKFGKGIKLHIGNSDVQVSDPGHLEKLKAVFKAANERRMAIVMHYRASFSKERPYGAEQARILIEQLLPLAPDVTVQIAHLASSGPGYDDPKVDALMDVFVDAIAKKDKRMRNVLFDLTTNIHPSNSPERAAMALNRIRQIGPQRILYGSDAALSGNQPPKDAWAEILKLGLTEKELKTIANNRAPYLR